MRKRNKQCENIPETAIDNIKKSGIAQSVTKVKKAIDLNTYVQYVTFS